MSNKSSPGASTTHLWSQQQVHCLMFMLKDWKTCFSVCMSPISAQLAVQDQSGKEKMRIEIVFVITKVMLPNNLKLSKETLSQFQRQDIFWKNQGFNPSDSEVGTLYIYISSIFCQTELIEQNFTQHPKSANYQPGSASNNTSSDSLGSSSFSSTSHQGTLPLEDKLVDHASMNMKESRDNGQVQHKRR